MCMGRDLMCMGSRSLWDLEIVTLSYQRCFDSCALSELQRSLWWYAYKLLNCLRKYSKMLLFFFGIVGEPSIEYNTRTPSRRFNDWKRTFTGSRGAGHDIGDANHHGTPRSVGGNSQGDRTSVLSWLSSRHQLVMISVQQQLRDNFSPPPTVRRQAAKSPTSSS